MITALFVYGTLMPGQSRWHVLAPYAAAESVPDQIPGALRDTGCGYPALIEADAGALVDGWVVPLHGDRLDAALARVDEIEGTATGLYARVAVTTLAGRRCWTYRYRADVTGMPDLGGSWPSRR